MGNPGPAIGRAEVGEDEAVALEDGIGAVAQPSRDRAVRRLAGHLENRSVHVEQPAVVAAPDSALRDDAVLERRAPVTAVPVEQAEPPREIAEQHQLLAEHGNRGGVLSELLDHRHRNPEPPEVLAARGARAPCGSAPDPRARPRRGDIRRRAVHRASSSRSFRWFVLVSRGAGLPSARRHGPGSTGSCGQPAPLQGKAAFSDFKRRGRIHRFGPVPESAGRAPIPGWKGLPTGQCRRARAGEAQAFGESARYGGQIGVRSRISVNYCG